MTAVRIRTLNKCINSFLGNLVELHKDNVFLLILPEKAFLASTCMRNLKPVRQARVPDEINRPFSQECWGRVSVCCLYSAKGCRDGSLPRTIFLIVTTL